MNGSGATPIQAVLNRFTKWRLPRTLDIQRRVERGEPLNPSDVLFLEGVSEDTTRARAMISRHPELEPLTTRLIELHDEIVRKSTTPGP